MQGHADRLSHGIRENIRICSQRTQLFYLKNMCQIERISAGLQSCFSYVQSEHWHSRECSASLPDSHLPDIASCWILNCRLMVGFSSGFDVPACRLMLPFRLGSFWGFIFPTSHDSSFKEQKMQQSKRDAVTPSKEESSSNDSFSCFSMEKVFALVSCLSYQTQYRLKEQLPQTSVLPLSFHKVPQKPTMNDISTACATGPISYV